MQRYGISQLPVVRQEPPASRSPTSSARSRSAACSTASSRTRTRSTRTSPWRCSRRFGAVDVGDSLDACFADLSGPSAAVVVARGVQPAAILTRSDLLEFLAARRLQVQP